MEGRLTEEKITKAIMSWLEKNGWEIICFDFPQSGTGKVLHPKCRDSKNKNAIIPDIVAVKKDASLFFENKDRFDFTDFVKVNALRNVGDYEESIRKLLENLGIKHIYYGIGLPKEKSIIEKALNSRNMTDFIVSVSSENIQVVHNSGKVRFE